jgi:hypothetical protein
MKYCCVTCRSAADAEFTTPPSSPGSPAAAVTFAERRAQRTKSSGLSSAPSAGNASMSGALAAAGGSTELVDMRGYEDSGHHAPKAAGVFRLILHTPASPHAPGHPSIARLLKWWGPSRMSSGDECCTAGSKGARLGRGKAAGQVPGAPQRTRGVLGCPCGWPRRAQFDCPVLICTAAGQGNSSSGPLPSHLEHAGSAGDRYRASDAAEAPYRAADFCRNSSGRAFPAHAASSSGGSSYSGSSRSRRDGTSTPDRAAGGCTCSRRSGWLPWHGAKEPAATLLRLPALMTLS